MTARRQTRWDSCVGSIAVSPRCCHRPTLSAGGHLAAVERRHRRGLGRRRDRGSETRRGTRRRARRLRVRGASRHPRRRAPTRCRGRCRAPCEWVWDYHPLPNRSTVTSTARSCHSATEVASLSQGRTMRSSSSSSRWFSPSVAAPSRGVETVEALAGCPAVDLGLLHAVPHIDQVADLHEQPEELLGQSRWGSGCSRERRVSWGTFWAPWTAIP